MKKISIIGLGYVGLPLAVAFSRVTSVIGFDVSARRISDLNNGIDKTLEVDSKDLLSLQNIKFTNNTNDIQDSNFYIITVPTPIDIHNEPDLSCLIAASQTVGRVLKSGDIVVYESTVYPGCTEEVCIPILENESKLRINKDFYCGYSPERINPGDKQHNISTIKKITSGSTPEAAEIIDEIYNQIITAGTFKAASIKTAEAAKVIENTQRDLNIALVNELSIIFNILGIDTNDVLDAAATKWNFMKFQPGLVGGHCIGVDPYYLTYKSQSVGYVPEIILAGRRLNDSMHKYIASKFIKKLSEKKININSSKILILGMTFKENCADIRNTKVINLYRELLEYNCSVDIYDPWAYKDDAFAEYGVQLVDELKENSYDGLLIAVRHKDFIDWGIDKIRKLCKPESVVYDIKSAFNHSEVDIRL